MSQGWIGYLCAGLFALGIPVAVVQLMPGRTYLQVDSEGFTYWKLFRQTFIPWSVVDHFFVVTLRRRGTRVHELVGFNFVPSYDRARLGRRIAAAVAKCEGALPDAFGKKAGELAEFMNARLNKAKSG